MDLQSLRDWALHLMTIIVPTIVVGTLVIFLRDSLVALLRRMAQAAASSLRQRRADRFFERRYLNWIGKECQRSTLIGVIPAEPGRQPALPDVFVVPAFSEHRVMPRLEELDGRPGLLERPGEVVRPLLPGEALDRRTVVILGEPGSGKSTLLRFLALACVDRAAERSYLEQLGLQPGRRVPVILPLLEFASSSEPLPVFVEEHVARHTAGVLRPPRGYFERLYQKGLGLFLLDGLDEVLGLGEDAYRRACEAVDSLAAVENGNRFVVTSRIVGWRGMLSHDFVPIYIEPFDEPRRRGFVERWYQAMEAGTVTGGGSADETHILRRRAREQAGDLIGAIEGSERLKRLAANPLLLSVMALVHRTDMLLPRDRARLYGRCAELLLERWDVGRGVEDGSATGLTLAQREAMLRHVARRFHENGRRFAPRREVKSLLAEFLPSLGQPAERAAEMLNWVERRTGLLADGEYLTFAHLGFQEYFTAQSALHDLALRESLLQPERLLDPWWREVVLLLVGIADDATDFVRRVYSPEEDDLLRRRLFLAGRCAGEATRVDEPLRNGIRDALLQVWRETPFKKQREAALAALAVQPTKGIADHFVTALGDENVEVRRKAAWALAELRVKSPDVAKALLEAMEDRDAWVRKTAASALGQLELKQERVLNALLQAVHDESEAVRQGVAWALGRLGVAEKTVTSALRVAVQDADGEVRRNAWEAFQRLGMLDQRMVNDLFEALGDSEAERRAIAVEALGMVQGKDARVVEALLEAMNDADGEVRANATRALSNLETKDGRVVGPLWKATRDRDVRVRGRAVWTLARLAVNEESLMSAVLELVREEDPRARRDAVSALGELGVAEEHAVDALLEALKDESAAVRAAAGWALGRLGMAEERVVDALLEALRDDGFGVQSSVFGALWELSERQGLWIGPNGVVWETRR